MKLVRSLDWWYLVGDLWGHKSFEVGVQHGKSVGRGFEVCWRFNTQGDHAGLLFSVVCFGWLFEASLYDTRHWNWLEDRWMRPGEVMRLPERAETTETGDDDSYEHDVER